MITDEYRGVLYEIYTKCRNLSDWDVLFELHDDEDKALFLNWDKVFNVKN